MRYKKLEKVNSDRSGTVMRNRKATGENVPIDRLVDLFKTGKATFFTFTVAQLANERKSNLDWSVVVPA